MQATVLSNKVGVRYLRAELQAKKIMAQAELESLDIRLAALTDDVADGEGVQTTTTVKTPTTTTKTASGKSPTETKIMAAGEDEDGEEFEKEEQTDETEDGEVEEISDEEIRKAFARYAKTKGPKAATALLQKYKVKKSGDLDQEQRAEIMVKIG